MKNIDGTGTERAGGVVKICFRNPASRSRSYFDPALIQRGELCSQPQNNTSCLTVQRRVSFSDDLVTDTVFRPPTKDEDKTLLYYTADDYALFALEDSYHQAMVTMEPSKDLAWRACMTFAMAFEGDRENKIPIEEMTIQQNSMRMVFMPRVKTLHNLQL